MLKSSNNIEQFSQEYSNDGIFAELDTYLLKKLAFMLGQKDMKAKVIDTFNEICFYAVCQNEKNVP